MGEGLSKGRTLTSPLLDPIRERTSVGMDQFLEGSSADRRAAIVDRLDFDELRDHLERIITTGFKDFGEGLVRR